MQNDWGLYLHWWHAQAGGLYDIEFHTHDEILKDEGQYDTVDGFCSDLAGPGYSRTYLDHSGILSQWAYFDHNGITKSFV